MVGFLGDNMEKIVKQEFEINAQEKSRTRLDIKLFSQDVNTAIFNMSFTQDGKPVVLDDSYKIPVLFLFRKNGRKVMVDAVIKNGIATVVFDNRWITEWDIVDAYTYLNKDNQTIDANAFSFKVELSAVDQFITDIKTYYIEDIEDIKKEYTGLLDMYINELPTPQELKGDAGTIEIDSISMIGEDEEPKIINSGTVSSAKLSFFIPRSEKGERGFKGDNLKIDHTFNSYDEMYLADKNSWNDGDYSIIMSDDADYGKLYEYKNRTSTMIAKLSGQQGIQGEPGESIKGDPGDSIKGDTGDNGDSAYEIAVKNGYTGTKDQWLGSLKAVWVQLTRAQYEQKKANGTLIPTTLYMVVN